MGMKVRKPRDVVADGVVLPGGERLELHIQRPATMASIGGLRITAVSRKRIGRSRKERSAPGCYKEITVTAQYRDET